MSVIVAGLFFFWTAAALTADAQAAEPPAAGEGQGSSARENPRVRPSRPVPERSQRGTPARRVAAAQEDSEMPEHPFPRRMQAPPLDGGIAWLNTSGPLDLESLRGKFVILDFWTYCCINCIHILPELKKLEEAYPNELVVIGVHSAKFEAEQDSQNIRDAILRYEIIHPVVNDAEHAIWNSYAVNSWPSLRVIDPEGNLVAGNSGEIEFEVLDGFMKQAIPYYRAKGTLDERPLRFDLEEYTAQKTPLRYPGKILADEAGDRLFITDSNHNRIIITRLDGTLLDIIGSGATGRADGDYATASFNLPQGVALDGETLYVADTSNHLLRKIDLQAKNVSTIAGTGKQRRGAWPGMEEDPTGQFTTPARFVGSPLETAIASPWALWVHEDELYIAMAGPHQIWKMSLTDDEIGPYAGNGREDIVDGPLLPKKPYAPGFASFAQPSGLTSDGTWLYVADSEGSSIRAVPFDSRKKVQTVVGTAHLPGARLFTFGDQDGRDREVLLQHALGVEYYQDKLYIADTYNNKIKVLDPKTKTVMTLAGTGEPGASDDDGTFDEPAGIAAAAGKLFVADTNNHLIRVVHLDEGNRISTLQIPGLTPPKAQKSAPPSFPAAMDVALEPVTIAADAETVTLNIRLDLPPGYKLNELAPLTYLVESSGDVALIKPQALGKLTKVDPPRQLVDLQLPLTGEQGTAPLKVSLSYYFCEEGNEGLCKIGSVVWTIPVTVAEGANTNAITLPYTITDRPILGGEFGSDVGLDLVP